MVSISNYIQVKRECNYSFAQAEIITESLLLKNVFVVGGCLFIEMTPILKLETSIKSIICGLRNIKMNYQL